MVLPSSAWLSLDLSLLFDCQSAAFGSSVVIHSCYMSGYFGGRGGGGDGGVVVFFSLLRLSLSTMMLFISAHDLLACNFIL